jgi:hypothetical protein
MHILTGLLISAFLGKKQATKGSEAVIGFRNILEVRHTISGRMRLYAPVLRGNPSLGEHLVVELGKADGITTIETSPVTGTVMIEFTSGKVKAPIVFGAVAHLLGLEEEIDKPPQSLMASGIKSATESLNRALYEKSGGIIDLWTLIPMSLVGFALYQMRQPGGIGTPGAFTLLWWAYMQLSRNEGRDER